VLGCDGTVLLASSSGQVQGQPMMRRLMMMFDRLFLFLTYVEAGANTKESTKMTCVTWPPRIIDWVLVIDKYVTVKDLYVFDVFLYCSTNSYSNSYSDRSTPCSSRVLPCTSTSTTASTS
jgi:hypothetical protein